MGNKIDPRVDKTLVFSSLNPNAEQFMGIPGFFTDNPKDLENVDNCDFDTLYDMEEGFNGYEYYIPYCAFNDPIRSLKRSGLF